MTNCLVNFHAVSAELKHASNNNYLTLFATNLQPGVVFLVFTAVYCIMDQPDNR